MGGGCGEIWRVMVCMMCVVWCVMCQCGLELMGAMLFKSGMLCVFFMWERLRNMRIYIKKIISMDLWLVV